MEKELYKFLRSPKERGMEEEIWEKDFHYSYPHEEATHLYPKYSVSMLKEEAIERLKEEATETVKEETRKISAVRIQKMDEEAEDSRCYSEKKERSKGALIGDSFHNAFALFD